MRAMTGVVFLAVLVLFFIGNVHAQVTREEGVKSIARVLDMEDGADEFTFRGMAGQILFADIDGVLYQTRGAHEEHEALSAEEGGCSDEGGPLQFCLQVLLDGEVLCWTGRPAPPPGWQRDPRLACYLEESSTNYMLRIFWTEVEGGCEDGIVTPPGEILPYLLNISLRNSVPEGRIEPAIGQSRNQF